jgi:Cysteine-rich secretory protein family
VRCYRDFCRRRVFAGALLVTWLLVCRGLAQAQFEEAGEQQLVRLINQERARRGLRPLAVDQPLTLAARKHTELMAKHKALSHQFDGEPTLEVRFADENLRSDRQAENIDLSANVPLAHQAFMRLPGHRANILNTDYNVVGVAVLRSGDQVYVTEDFAHRVTAYSGLEADAVLQRAIERYATSHGMSAPVRKAQSQLRHLACEMALNDSLQSPKVANLPGVQEVAAWTTFVPGKLPSSAKELLSHPLSSGYSLGACFAPSVSQPGGTYWVVMVVY